MFDYVNVVIPCPKCGEEISGFQSKDERCSLEVIDPTQVANFYSSCPKCGTWVEYIREYDNNPPYRDTPFNKEEIEALGFVRVTDVKREFSLRKIQKR